LNGRDYCLEPWKSAASGAEYNRLTTEWMASGGTLTPNPQQQLTIVELLAAFWKHAQTYSVDADGRPTSERRARR